MKNSTWNYSISCPRLFKLKICLCKIKKHIFEIFLLLISSNKASKVKETFVLPDLNHLTV